MKIVRRWWFGDHSEDGFVPCDRDTITLAERYLRYSPEGLLSSKPVCTDAISGGFVENRVQYIQEIRNLSLHLVSSDLSVFFSSSEARLVQLVRILDECDRGVSRLSEQVIEWERYHQSVQSRSALLHADKRTLYQIADSNKDVVSSLSKEIIRLMDVRREIAEEVTRLAKENMPNTSAILGPLVATRMIMQAGSLAKLAVLPSSSIQVLGARYALFSHIRSATPPPKHGVIFQHKRIHNSSKRVRGSVSRAIASRVAIAARIDLFRGDLDPVFLKKSEDKIKKSGA